MPKVNKDLLAECLLAVLDTHAKGDAKHYRKRLRNPRYLKQVMRSNVGRIYRTFKPTKYI